MKQTIGRLLWVMERLEHGLTASIDRRVLHDAIADVVQDLRDKSFLCNRSNPQPCTEQCDGCKTWETSLESWPMHDELFAMYWKDQERTNFYSHSPSQIYSGLLNVYQAGYRAALSDEPQGPYDDNGHMDADRDLERLIESGRQFRLRMAKSPDEAMNIALSANDLARIGFALRQLSKNTTKKPAIHVLGQEHTVDKKTPQP